MSTFLEINKEAIRKLLEEQANKIDKKPLFFSILTQYQGLQFLLSEYSKNDKPIKLTCGQETLLALLKSNKRLLVHKDRQVGESLTMALYLALECYYENKDIIIIAPTLKIGYHLLEEIKLMLTIITNKNNEIENFRTNKATVYLNGRTKIIVLPSNPTTFCSFSPDIIYFTEAAYIENLSEMLESANFALKENGQIIMSSTSGQYNLFQELLEDENPSNPFTKFQMKNPENVIVR